jgi:hypothetical protein
MSPTAAFIIPSWGGGTAGRFSDYHAEPSDMMELSLIQSNLNHCSAAQDLILQYMVEEKVDIALLSDHYRIPTTSNAWLTGTGSCRAAIYTAGDGVTVANVLRDAEFVSARLNGVQIFCCYASPNQTHEEFGDFLHRLEVSVRSIHRGVPVLIAGDLKGKRNPNLT